MHKTLKLLLPTLQWLIFIGLLFFSFIILSPFLPIKDALLTHIIITGSMEPVIKSGSVVLTQPINPATLKTGDIIAFSSPSNPKDTIIHRVDSISNTNPLTFKTKGDANNAIDDWDVMASGVLGIHLLTIPYLGYAGSFVRTPLGFGLIIGLPALIFIIFQIINIKKNNSPKLIASLLIFGLSLSITSFIVTTALFSHSVTISGLNISVTDFVPPPVPILISPANNTYVNTSGLVMDWGDVVDYENQHQPVSYYYRSCADSLCTVIRYNSAKLSNSFIPAPGTPQGIYYWQVRACDSIDNCSPWSLPWKVTVDNTPPVVTINSPINDQFILGNIPINITVSDTNLSHYWLVVQNLPGTTVAGLGTVSQHSSLSNQNVYTWNISGLPEGDYIIKLEARDLAGNKTPNLAPVLFDPDSPTDSVDWITVHINNPPSTPTGITILNNFGLNIGCSGYVNHRSITIDWQDNPEPDFAYYNYDIKDQNNFKKLTTSQYVGDIRDLDGIYKYRVSALDTHGLESPETDWCYVTLDRQLPTSSITNPTDVDTSQIYSATTPTLNINYSIADTNPHKVDLYYSADIGATWTKVDTNTNSPLGSFSFTPPLTSGSTLICFDTVARDLAGNIETNILPSPDILNPLTGQVYCLIYTIGSPPLSLSATHYPATNQLAFSLANIPTDFGANPQDSLNYELLYNSSGLSKGILGTVYPVSPSPSSAYTTTINEFLGSCTSGGTCTPDSLDNTNFTIKITGNINGSPVNINQIFNL